MQVNTIGINGIEMLGYKVNGGNGGQFSASNEDVRIDFIVEVRNGGIYTKMIGLYNKNSNRYYQSTRYFMKYIGTVQDLGYELTVNNYTWDYVLQCNGLESYAWGIKPYIEKCIALGKTY